MAPVTRQSSRLKLQSPEPSAPREQEEEAVETPDETPSPIQPSSESGTAKQAALTASAHATRRPRTVAARTVEKQLTQFHSLPEYLQDNEFITAYYRAPDQTWRSSVSTLFGIHNETGNVWTHLVGFLVFVGLTFYIASSPPTPLAFGTQQVDNLWGSMSHRLTSLKDTLHLDLPPSVKGSLQHLHHNLQSALHLDISLPTLPDAASSIQRQLASSLSNSVHTMSEDIAHTASALRHHLDSVGDALSGPLHSVSEALSGPLHSVGEALSGPLHSVGEALSGPLHRAGDMLSGPLHSVSEALSGPLHSVGEALSGPMHSVGEVLSGPLHSVGEAFSDNVQGVRERVARVRALLHMEVDSSLGILQWPVARWPTFVYMAGAMTCLLLSSVCHLLGCCNRHVALLVWRVDYAGIAILIVTSFFPPVYYGFMCEPFWRNFYLVTTTIMGVGAVCVSLMDRFQTTQYRAVRAGMFSALGLWGLAPVVQMWFVQNHVFAVKQALMLDLIMGGIYLLGAVVYAMRVPERWMPGTFDIALHSHQIFHVAVVLASLIHFRAVLMLLEWRDASGGCAAPITSGPVGHVMREMQELSGGLFGLEQVQAQVRGFAAEHFGAL